MLDEIKTKAPALLLRSGQAITGARLLSDPDQDWYTLVLDDGTQARVRETEVVAVFLRPPDTPGKG